MKRLTLAKFAAIAILISLGVANAPVAQGQTAPAKFEVASIKPWVPDAGLALDYCKGDRFRLSGLRFGYLLVWTYGLRGATAEEFLDHVPSSLQQKTYDIQAKAAGPVGPESQCRLMVQALLADRFKLTFHYEDRNAEVLDLVLLRDEPKMQRARPTDEGSDINIVVDGRVAYTWAPIEDADVRAHTKGMTMKELAQRLPTTAPQPVTDKTGLEGRYKIDLRYSTLLPASVDGPPVDPPVDAALAKLGLRLEKRKVTVKVPVLDHIEPPDAN